jgi:hypothetical protein
MGVLPVIATIPFKTSSDEFERLSMMTTSKPSFCNSTTVCDPINPKPPVTNIFMCCFLNGVVFYCNALAQIGGKILVIVRLPRKLAMTRLEGKLEIAPN